MADEPSGRGTESIKKESSFFFVCISMQAFLRWHEKVKFLLILLTYTQFHVR